MAFLLAGHSKGTWTLQEHSKGPQGHLSIRALKALAAPGIWAFDAPYLANSLKHYKGTSCRRTCMFSSH